MGPGNNQDSPLKHDAEKLHRVAAENVRWTHEHMNTWTRDGLTKLRWRCMLCELESSDQDVFKTLDLEPEPQPANASTGWVDNYDLVVEL